eukprot:GILK01015057.1.p1 GENE.GILK01015057.1~~GILK01015057.1.p1  ORF type:complete len:130 (-),score=3.81 GILK01015057.1:386-775(-)
MASTQLTAQTVVYNLKFDFCFQNQVGLATGSCNSRSTSMHVIYDPVTTAATTMATSNQGNTKVFTLTVDFPEDVSPTSDVVVKIYRPSSQFSATSRQACQAIVETGSILFHSTLLGPLRRPSLRPPVSQ